MPNPPSLTSGWEVVHKLPPVAAKRAPPNANAQGSHQTGGMVVCQPSSHPEVREGGLTIKDFLKKFTKNLENVYTPVVPITTGVLICNTGLRVKSRHTEAKPNKCLEKCIYKYSHLFYNKIPPRKRDFVMLETTSFGNIPRFKLATKKCTP